MAHSNYKILTDADLSGNEIYNVSRIVNEETASSSLSIETTGDTALKAANLKGNVTGETSLTTDTSNVTVGSTATETITTSKTTTVASTTTETINSSGINVTTPSQKVTATGSAKTVSPSIIAITEEVKDEVASKGSYSKIDLSKTGATATITAKKYTVDADATGGSITQTAPTSIYKASTNEDNMVKLTTSNVTIKSGGETVQLSKGSTAGSIIVNSKDLQLHTDKLTVDKNTSITSASFGAVTLKSNSAGSASATNGSTLNLTNTEANVSAPTVTIVGKNGTSSENCQVQAKVGSTSVTIVPQDIKLDSDGTLHLESDNNTEIKTTEAGTSITLDTKQLIEKATTSSKTTSPSITLVTDKTEGTGVNQQAKIALTKTPGADDSKVDISAKDVAVTAVTDITQKAPTSTYKADEDNKVSLTTSSVEIRSSDAEILKLTKAAGSISSSTDLTSKNLKLHAGAVEVDGNTSIITASKGTVTIKSNSTGNKNNGNDTTLTLNNATASLTAPIVSITSNSDAETSDTNRKIVATAGNTSATIKTTDINLTSAGTMELSSTGNTTIKTTGANTELELSTKNLIESASTVKTTAPSITIQTGDTATDAKLVLAKTTDTKSPSITTSAKTITADAITTITQTAPTSTYQTDSSGTSKVLLNNTGVTIKSGDTETIALNRSSKTTTLTSNKLIADADVIETNGNQTTTIASSTSITAKAETGANISTVTIKPTDLSIDSDKVLISGDNTTEAIKLTAGNTVASILPQKIDLNSDGAIALQSDTGVSIIDDTSAAVTAPTITETATTSMKLYSGDVVLQPSDTDTTKQISLKKSNNTVAIKADDASVTAVGGTSNKVTVAGTELAVDSTSSTFKNSATFSKNVTVTGNLKTSNITGEAAILNSLDVKAATTVQGDLNTGDLTLNTTTGTSAELQGKLTVTEETFVNNTATIGTLKVTGELTAKNGLESTGKVTISNQGSNEGISLTVNSIASTGTLTVDNTKTLEANGGLVSAGKVSVVGKDTNEVSVTVNKTASTGILAVHNTKTLEANGGLVSAGKVDIQNAGSNSGTSLTVNKTATTGILAVTGTLTASNGLTSVGAVKIEKASGVENALTVNTSATTDTLNVKEGLTANGGMTSNGNITISGTTSITTLEGAGKLTIPENYSLEAKNGGTTGSVDVSKVTINTIDGLGSLIIPNGKTLTADTAAGSTAKVTGNFTPTNIDVNTVMGSGSIEIASGKTLKIDPVSGSEVKVEGSFTPTNISVGTVKGDGSISISSGRTLTVKNNGTVNGSMIVGKSDSTATNMSINGTLTVGTNGGTATSLTSKVPVVAESTLNVTGKTTFKGAVEVEAGKEFVLNGVTIKWDSNLGALTFSRR